ncbi:MAG: hypothetical protein NT137_00155 [Methanomassiliicoccales archaeon]|nr:hypothetical protein [Methanomassiliicoccales archaeon]
MKGIEMRLEKLETELHAGEKTDDHQCTVIFGLDQAPIYLGSRGEEHHLAPPCGRIRDAETCLSCALVKGEDRHVLTGRREELHSPEWRQEDPRAWLLGSCYLIVVKDKEGRILSADGCGKGLELGGDLRECESEECRAKGSRCRTILTLSPPS